jgi:hypothetical protein
MGEISHPGNTNFNVEDRMAIINLCNSYAAGYDADDFEQWLKLFTDDPSCTVRLADAEPTIFHGDNFRNAFQEMRASASRHHVKPLHYNTNLRVTSQSDRSAVVESYMLYVPLDVSVLRDAVQTLSNTRITGTARYLFSLLKGEDGVWRIDKYSIKFDQLVVEATL